MRWAGTTISRDKRGILAQLSAELCWESPKEDPNSTSIVATSACGLSRLRGFKPLV